MIKIFDDTNSEMMKIEKDGKCVFEGNYWDFQNNPTGISDLLDSLGVEHGTHTYEYDE